MAKKVSDLKTVVAQFKIGKDRLDKARVQAAEKVADKSKYDLKGRTIGQLSAAVIANWEKYSRFPFDFKRHDATTEDGFDQSICDILNAQFQIQDSHAPAAELLEYWKKLKAGEKTTVAGPAGL